MIKDHITSPGTRWVKTDCSLAASVETYRRYLAVVAAAKAKVAAKENPAPVAIPPRVAVSPPPVPPSAPVAAQPPSATQEPEIFSASGAARVYAT